MDLRQLNFKGGLLRLYLVAWGISAVTVVWATIYGVFFSSRGNGFDFDWILVLLTGIVAPGIALALITWVIQGFTRR